MSEFPDDIIDNISNSHSLEKDRHGCITAWLIIMIVANILGSLATTFTTTDLGYGAGTPDVFGPIVWVLAIIGLANAFFAVLLLKWKKIGFTAFAIVAVITFCINIYGGLDAATSSVGFFGVGVLYAILQIKNQSGKSAWELLE